MLDYAIVNWIPHLLASMDASSSDSPSKPTERVLAEFVEILGIFLELHWKPPDKKSRVSRIMVDTVKCLPRLEDTQKSQLLQTLASASGLISSDLQDSTCLEASKLYNTLRAVRLTLERLNSDVSSQVSIRLFYGTSVFKCPRLYCKWFYEGFETAQQRDEHVSKHERAYFCPYIGCTHATLGCKTDSELELHCQTYHKPEFSNDEFPLSRTPFSTTTTTTTPSRPLPSTSAASSMDTQSPATTLPATSNLNEGSTATTRPSTIDPAVDQRPAKRIRQTGPFTCHVCTKVFQNNAYLTSHTRVHTTERKFSCAMCSKSFTRQPDLSRH